MNQRQAHAEESDPRAALWAAMADACHDQHDPSGDPHPVVDLIDQTRDLLASHGFGWRVTPEIDDVWHSFDLLEIPVDHPTRTSAHTMLLPGGRLLRSHTTSSVMRALLAARGQGAVRVAVGGACHRRTIPSPRFVTRFHQVEAAAVGTDAGLGDLIALAHAVGDELLGRSSEPRLRLRSLPYVSPGIAVDLPCTACGGAGCGLCAGRGYLEIMSGGIFRASIRDRIGIGPDNLAWSLAVSMERILALRDGRADIRPYVTADGGRSR